MLGAQKATVGPLAQGHHGADGVGAEESMGMLRGWSTPAVGAG